MNFLGMGPMEIIVIFLVAFLLLGHERMIDAARLMGKAVKEIRRMTISMAQIIPEDEIVQANNTPRSTSETNVRTQGNHATLKRTYTSESPDNDLVTTEESVEFRSSTDVSIGGSSNQESTSE